MKNISTRTMVAVGLCLLMALSWFTLIQDTQKANDEYDAILIAAREKVQQELYTLALEHYAEAMELRDSIQLRDEIAQVYQDHAGSDAYESFCEDMIADFPLEIRGYERLADFYRNEEAYDSCFNIIETIKKRHLKSETIDAIAQELAYAYALERVSAIDVSSFSGGYYAIQYKSESWGFVNSLGKTTTAGSYKKVSHFSASGNAVVQLTDGRLALINSSGTRVMLSPETLKAEDFSALISGKIAVKYDGKYHYLNEKFEELFGAYDYAGTFYGGAAAVKEGSKWAIIDESGKNLTDFVFEDIKLDDKGIAFRDGRALAKRDGVYILIDTKGNQLGTATWEEADAFNADMIAAVKNNGKWGFVDAEGKVVVDYQYAAAKSFSNGMAAIEIDGKWGYISKEDFEIVIAPSFGEANDFSSGGTAFVKESGNWRLLRIYRLT